MMKDKLPKKMREEIARTTKLGMQMAKEKHEAEHEALRKAGDEFLRAIREAVNYYVLVHDIEGLDRLVTQVHMVQDHAVLEALRNKGFSKEIEALCDRAGSKVLTEQPRVSEAEFTETKR